MLRKDHIVPASIIGRFRYLPEGECKEGKINWRRQEVLKRDICESRTECVTAEDIGYSVGEQDANFTSKEFDEISKYYKDQKIMDNGYYKGYKIDPIDLDKNIFHKTERSIGDIINLLEMHKELDEGRFGILVSYIAQMFVRSPFAREFIKDFLRTDILEMIEGLTQKDKENIIRNSIQVNRERLYEMYESKYLERYKFRILVDNKRRFVLSDLGISPWFMPMSIEDPPGGGDINFVYRLYINNPKAEYGVGYCIPLSGKVVVVLIPKSFEEWEMGVRNIEYVNISESRKKIDVMNVNAIHTAQNFYVAPSEDLINFYSQNGVESTRMNPLILRYFLFRDYIEDESPGSFKASLHINDERVGKEGFQALDINKRVKDLLKGSPDEISFAKEWLSYFRNSLLRYIGKLED